MVVITSSTGRTRDRLRTGGAPLQLALPADPAGRCRADRGWRRRSARHIRPAGAGGRSVDHLEVVRHAGGQGGRQASRPSARRSRRALRGLPGWRPLVWSTRSVDVVPPQRRSRRPPQRPGPPPQAHTSSNLASALVRSDVTGTCRLRHHGDPGPSGSTRPAAASHMFDAPDRRPRVRRVGLSSASAAAESCLRQFHACRRRAVLGGYDPDQPERLQSDYRIPDPGVRCTARLLVVVVVRRQFQGSSCCLGRPARPAAQS